MHIRRIINQCFSLCLFTARWYHTKVRGAVRLGDVQPDGIRMYPIPIFNLITEVQAYSYTNGDWCWRLTWLEGFDSDWCRIVPQSFPHLSKLAVANLAYQFEWILGDFPLVLRVVGQPVGLGFLHLPNTHKTQRGLNYAPALTTEDKNATKSDKNMG